MSGNEHPIGRLSAPLCCAIEVADERRDLVGRFVEREMTGFQQVDLRSGHVIGICGCASDSERGIVFTPNHEGLRLCLAQPFLPKRIGSDICAVIQEQGGLNVGLARAR